MQSIQHIWHHTRKRRVAGLLLVIFVIINGGIYLAYRGRTYPGTTINGQHVGSLGADKLADRISSLPLLPKQLTLQAKQHVTPADLGMKVDSEQTAKALLGGRSWLPVYNFVRPPRGTAAITVEPKTYQRQIQEIGKSYRRDAVNAQLLLRGNTFVAVPEINAESIDVSGSQAKIIEALSTGRDSAELALRAVAPAVTRDSLQPQLQDLQAQRATPITLSYQGKTTHFTPAQVGSWFVQTGDSFNLLPARINTAVADASLELGVKLDATDQITTAIQAAVKSKKAVSIPVTGNTLGKKTYSFCTAGRGVGDSDIRELSSKAQSVLNSGRGWSLNNHVTFWASTPGTGCDFTIWLASADQMVSFGAICDPLWSCTVSPNVIINYDRWRNGSEAWNKEGGNIQDYRAMAINHEVGHWLGFQHSNCPGPGQPGPVMLQQSINLQGCVFNPWPTATERLALRNYLNL